MVFLGGCGGGGGDGGGAAPPPAAAPAPPGAGAPAFRLTADNAGAAASYALFAVNVSMKLAHLVGKDMLRFEPASGRCDDGSTWERTIQDRDANGRPSPGDAIRVDYRGCAREPMPLGGLVGSIEVTIVEAAASRIVGEMRLGQAGLEVSDFPIGQRAPTVVITGRATLSVEVRPDGQSTRLGNATDADELAFEIPGLPFAPDRWRAFRFEKSQSLPAATTTLSLAGRFESPELDGGVDVDTQEPLSAWLDEGAPETGRGLVRFQTVDDRLLLRPSRLSEAFSPKAMRLELDRGADGSIDAAGDTRWDRAGLGVLFLWADPPLVEPTSFVPAWTGGFGLQVPIRSATRVDPDSRIELQFSRPPQGTASWRWTLLENVPGLLEGRPVPIEVVVDGAQLRITPRERLRYSRNYVLTVDTGQFVSDSARVEAVDGSELLVARGQVVSFRTPDFLPMGIFLVSPEPNLLRSGAVGTLSGPSPVAGAPDARYRWEQIAGTPLLIAQPDQLSTAVQVAPGASGVGEARVRLTIELADGASDSSEAIVRTLAEMGGLWIARLRLPDSGYSADPARDVWSGPAVATLELGLEGAALRIRVIEPNIDGLDRHPGWDLTLAPPAGLVLSPGTYDNAQGSASGTVDPARPTLDLARGGLSGSLDGSRFVIHELVVAADGQITRLAVDFEARNVTGVFASGSLRVGSDWPMPE